MKVKSYKNKDMKVKSYENKDKKVKSYETRDTEKIKVCHQTLHYFL